MAAAPKDAWTTKNANLVSASMPLYRVRGASSGRLACLGRCNTLSESGLVSDNLWFGFRAQFARSSPWPQLDDSAERRTRIHSWVLPLASPWRPQFWVWGGWLFLRACSTRTSSCRLLSETSRSVRLSFSLKTSPLPTSVAIPQASLSQPCRFIEDSAPLGVR